MRESDGCVRNFGMGPLIPVLVRSGGTVMEGHRLFLIDKAWREDKTIARLGKLPTWRFPSWSRWDDGGDLERLRPVSTRPQATTGKRQKAGRKALPNSS